MKAIIVIGFMLESERGIGRRFLESTPTSSQIDSEHKKLYAGGLLEEGRRERLIKELLRFLKFLLGNQVAIESLDFPQHLGVAVTGAFSPLRK